MYGSESAAPARKSRKINHEKHESHEKRRETLRRGMVRPSCFVWRGKPECEVASQINSKAQGVGGRQPQFLVLTER